MAAGPTYTPIASASTSGSASSYTFSSIPNTYTDLLLVVNGTNSSGSTEDLMVRYNGDTGSNYSRTYLEGTTSALGSGRTTGAVYAIIGGYIGSGKNFVSIFQFLNYSNTPTYKTSLSRANIGNAATYGIYTTAGLWSSTAAINSIQVFWPSAGTFGNGTTLTLYGIAAA
jgi:hypothetical protein